LHLPKGGKSGLTVSALFSHKADPDYPALNAINPLSMHLPAPPPPSIAPASWPLFWNTASVAFGPLRWRVTLIRPALMMMMMMGDG